MRGSLVTAGMQSIFHTSAPMNVLFFHRDIVWDLVGKCSKALLKQVSHAYSGS